jgi:hypothetical protein
MDVPRSDEGDADSRKDTESIWERGARRTCPKFDSVMPLINFSNTYDTAYSMVYRVQPLQRFGIIEGSGRSLGIIETISE